MAETNTELRDVIAEYGLTRKQAAAMMMVEKTTVDRYLAPSHRMVRRKNKPNPTYRAMPAHRLRLLLDEIRRARLQKVES